MGRSGVDCEELVRRALLYAIENMRDAIRRLKWFLEILYPELYRSIATTFEDNVGYGE